MVILSLGIVKKAGIAPVSRDCGIVRPHNPRYEACPYDSVFIVLSYIVLGGSLG